MSTETTETTETVEARLFSLAREYSRERQSYGNASPFAQYAAELLKEAARAFVRAEQEQGPVTYWVTVAVPASNGTAFADLGLTLPHPIRTKADVDALKAALGQMTGLEGRSFAILRCDRLENE